MLILSFILKKSPIWSHGKMILFFLVETNVYPQQMLKCASYACKGELNKKDTSENLAINDCNAYSYIFLESNISMYWQQFWL